MAKKTLRYNERGLIGESGHKAWDRHVNYVGTGNVCANGFTSAYIRPIQETVCNGKTFPPGRLQTADLEPFQRNFGVPQAILETIRSSKTSLILACAHHLVGPARNQRRIVHGWILTANANENHRLVKALVTGPTPKSASVLDWIVPIITNRP